MRRVTASLVLIVVATTSLLLVPGARAQGGDAETQFLQLIAAARSADGLPPLSVSPELTAIARRHAAEMAAAGRIYHQSLDPIDGQRVGENVGTGNPVQVVHDMFMASPSHRREILGQFSEVGIGVVWANGNLYVDELFRLPWAAAPAEEATPVPAAEPTLALEPAPAPMVPVVAPPVDRSTAPTTSPPVPSVDVGALSAAVLEPAVLAVAAASRPAIAHLELASAEQSPASSTRDGTANRAMVTAAALMIMFVMSAHLWFFRDRAGIARAVWAPVRRRATAH